jgi:hypothetical protein
MEVFGIFYVHLLYFMSICYILRPFATFYDHFAYYLVIWYIYDHFGML